jgi:hypothetical protein
VVWHKDPWPCYLLRVMFLALVCVCVCVCVCVFTHALAHVCLKLVCVHACGCTDSKLFAIPLHIVWPHRFSFKIWVKCSTTPKLLHCACLQNQNHMDDHKANYYFWILARSPRTRADTACECLEDWKWGNNSLGLLDWPCAGWLLSSLFKPSLLSNQNLYTYEPMICGVWSQGNIPIFWCLVFFQ